jgi:hypothetical protein
MGTAHLQKALVAALAAVSCILATPALAQDGGPPPDVRVRIGPLSMNPSIALSNIGIDHNVFNDPSFKDPKQDFTATVVPATDFWLRAGPTWITSSLIESITWFQKYSSERSAANQYKLGWVVPGSRMTFRINGDWRHAKERPGYEIDGRVVRNEFLYSGSADFNVFSKTSLTASASRLSTDFANDAVFDGTRLNVALNRHTTSGTLGVRQQVTALTSFSIDASRSTDQFELSPERDATTTAATLVLTFQPEALLKGGASIGYSQFLPNSSALPSYSGLVYSVNLTYVLLGATRFAAVGSRSVQYSYDNTQPYYVQTGITGSVAQELFGPIDLAFRAGIQDLAYRDLAGSAVIIPNRTDQVINYGLGVGYHLGTNLRLSLNVDKVFRDSRVPDRNYDNYTFTSSLNYGF